MKAVSIEPRLQKSFQHWQKNMVRYGLKAGLGQFYTNEDETAVLYEQGDFLFLAGQADMALLADYRDFCKPDYLKRLLGKAAYPLAQPYLLLPVMLLKMRQILMTRF